jgi:hypothetical protein
MWSSLPPSGARKERSVSIYAYVVQSDGAVRELLLTQEMLLALEQLTQRVPLQHQERANTGAVIGDFLTALKRAMHLDGRGNS